MLLTDYFRSEHDITWDFAKQCGVTHGVIRLPEDEAFDVTSLAHWKSVYQRFMDFGIKPVVIEPMPNALHDHIKAGDSLRDACIEKALAMLPIMDQLDIRIICFNFMAYVGWLRTDFDIPERGDARVSGFDLAHYQPTAYAISERALWENYTYFIKAMLPEAERYGVQLALHPDDPPVPRLGNVSRIMISYEQIRHAMDIGDSPNLGITMCQATYQMMGEDLNRVIPEMKDKIFFVHFRNAIGSRERFRETFHDNGAIPMAKTMQLYRRCGIDVPIRVDHVPTMAGEQEKTGYAALGRLYALGYLKGLLEAMEETL